MRIMAAGQQKITDEEILEFFEKNDDPVFSAGECGSAWGMTHEGARRRLNNLVDEGRLEAKKSGDRTKVYWLPSVSEFSAQ